MGMNAQSKFFGNTLPQSEADKPRIKIQSVKNKRKPRAQKKEEKSADKKIGRMEIRPTHVYFTNMKKFSVIYPPIVPPVRIYFRPRI